MCVPQPAGCVKATLNSTIEAYAVEFAKEETAHVTLLFNALTAAGLKPVCPLVNLGEGQSHPLLVLFCIDAHPL